MDKPLVLAERLRNCRAALVIVPAVRFLNRFLLGCSRSG
jgi:hypothetical protein